ncbi:2597_t:CDS:1, partial [Acaulospora colombiana]
CHSPDGVSVGHSVPGTPRPGSSLSTTPYAMGRMSKSNKREHASSKSTYPENKSQKSSGL